MMKPHFLLLAAAVVSPAFYVLTAQAAPAAAITSAVASADRPASDSQRDALRKPAQLIAFAGIKPGDRVADLIPGKGYFTRIFSKVVGPKGHVYAIVPTEFLKLAPKSSDDAKAIGAASGFANVSAITAPVASLSAPEPLDVAWTSDNYHDVYGFAGANAAAALDASVFKALKPGGIFMIIDHVARAGTSATSPQTLHRIDPATVKAQALAAGFTLAGESTLLHNPADTHDVVVFSPAIRGHTDQFVLKFRKPLN
jgi:predicted methyltransferase